MNLTREMRPNGGPAGRRTHLLSGPGASLLAASMSRGLWALAVLGFFSQLTLSGQTTYYGPDNNQSGNGAGFGTAANFTWNTTTAIWNTNATGDKIGGNVHAIAWVNGSTNNANLVTTTNTLTLTLGSAITVGSITANSGTGGSWTVANAGQNLTMNTGTTTNANLTLSGGTFSMAAAGTYTFNTITFSSGTTILDFGNSIGTTLQSTNLIVSPGASVTVNNWVAGSDAWRSTNAPTINGSTVATGGVVSNITFTNYTGLTTTWSSTGLSQQIAPVPEPSTYGAMLIAGCAGLMGWRRWRSRRESAEKA